jgi:tRNA threonylcarbamoyladenosine biosynthesis protein TsaE
VTTDRTTSWEFRASDENDTARLGNALARVLRPGLVIALVGDLGAGKTRLVQAIAAAMGVARDDVTSPTFVLIQEYDGELPLYHFDTYRLRDSDQFLELGADELMAGDGVCLVEWADRVADVLPPDCLRIEILTTGPTERQFRVIGSGPVSNAVVNALQQGQFAADKLSD